MNMKKAIIKNGSLILLAVVFVVFLVATVGPALSGTAYCAIIPSLRQDQEYYCPNCLNLKGLMVATCPILPTPGVSGCSCANDHCAGWIDNDICNWAWGIKVSRIVCNDLSGTICSEVAINGYYNSQTIEGGKIEQVYPKTNIEGQIKNLGPFPLEPFNETAHYGGIDASVYNNPDLVPAGGCCGNDEECSTKKCGGNLAADENSEAVANKTACGCGMNCQPDSAIGGTYCQFSPMGGPCRSFRDCADNYPIINGRRQNVDSYGTEIQSFRKATCSIPKGNEKRGICTCFGDVNGNGKVDLPDLVKLALSYGNKACYNLKTKADCDQAITCKWEDKSTVDTSDDYCYEVNQKYNAYIDFTDDGNVNLADLVLFANAYGSHLNDIGNQCVK